ncbi:MAG: cytidine deaminase [Oscillospiraceae bacterium]|nr:cytidine deaminase [Oscillospiraceae bacterium]
MTDKELVARSVEAQARAYAPYSGFKVGAALLCQSGDTFTGCNIENAAYGSTNCAERTAIFKAVSEGFTEFSAIAITSSGGKLTFPCGSCLQVMAEFSPSLRVILCEDGKPPVCHPLKELMPYAFRL